MTASNEIWHADSMECPIWVIPARHTSKRVKPWLVTIIDDHTRRIMSTLLTMERPSADDVVVALADAVRPKPLSAEGQYAGGLPEVFHTDNGGECKNKILQQGCARLGITLKRTVPYHKHLNGKVERVHRTIQDELIRGLPGFTGGPRTLSRRDLFGSDADVMGEEAFAVWVENWVEHYNSSRPHSALDGRTPNQVWCSQQTPLVHVDPQALRMSLLREENTPKVQQRGVPFKNTYYTAPELGTLVGSRVDVRYMPRDKSFIEVFRKGTWICTAFPHTAITDTQRQQIRDLSFSQYTEGRPSPKVLLTTAARPPKRIPNQSSLPTHPPGDQTPPPY